MIDDYFHYDANIIYISENIPGPEENTVDSVEIIENFNSQLMHNCKCDDRCLSESCKCLKISGGKNYALFQSEPYSIYNRLNRKSNVNCYPIYECNNLCKCSQNCGNRLVQNGPLKNLYVEYSMNKLKGLGLFTKCWIPEGSFLCEYAGEVLTKSQSSFRQHNNESHGKMNYIFCLNEHVNGKMVQTYIDPSNFGNIGRYINHSCDPNCEILPVRINSPIVKLAVFSILDIKPNTEITFDYGSSNDTPISNLATRKKCLCNTSKCKGFMPYFHY